MADNRQPSLLAFGFRLSAFGKKKRGQLFSGRQLITDG